MLKNTEKGNFLPCEESVRKEHSKITTHLDDDNVEAGKMAFKFLKEDETVLKKRGFIRVKNLTKFVNDVYNKIEVSH